MACGILVPGPGIEPAPPAVEAQSLNHWTAREVSHLFIVNTLPILFFFFEDRQEDFFNINLIFILY